MKHVATAVSSPERYILQLNSLRWGKGKATEISIFDPAGTWAWPALPAAMAGRAPGAVAEVRLHGVAGAEVRLRAVVAAEEWAAISVVSVDGQPRSASNARPWPLPPALPLCSRMSGATLPPGAVTCRSE